MKHIPNQCYIELTNKCNLSCSHCFASSLPENKQEMTKETAMKVIFEAVEMGVYWLNISGGETILYPDLFDILEYAVNLPVSISLLTNGTLWTEDHIAKLLKVDPEKKITIQVSLDGPTLAQANMHRNMTKQDWDRLLWLVPVLKEAGYQVSSIHVASHVTLSHTLETARFAIEELGVSAFQIVPYFPTGRGVDFLKAYDLFWVQWSNFLVNLTKQKISNQENYLKYVALGVFTIFELVIPLDDAGLHEMIFNVWGLDTSSKEAFKKQSRRDIYCEAGLTELAISSNSHIFPCVASLRTDFDSGCIHPHGLKAAYEASQVGEWFRNIHTSVRQLEPCAKCNYSFICSGGCRLAAKGILGDAKLPDPRCPIVRRSIEDKSFTYV